MSIDKKSIGNPYVNDVKRDHNVIPPNNISRDKGGRRENLLT